MNIYCIGRHVDEFYKVPFEVPKIALQYAYFSAIGTWKYERPPCDVCQWHWQSRVDPLLVQWEPFRDNIGDFSYNGHLDVEYIVTEPVARFFEQRHFGCELRSIKYVKPEFRKRISCVPFPYHGPKQTWAECVAKIDLDHEASGVVLKSKCEVCGNERFTPKYHGIIIRKSVWNGETMFRIRTNGRSAATFVTEEAKRQIEEAGFTNFICMLAGEIVD